MFSQPNIDKDKSIKIIIHTLLVENEYVPTLEIVFPTEEDMTIEVLFAMREAIDFANNKINKVLDSMI